MTETTQFVARTAKGAAIAFFDERDQAMAWAEANGHQFPGWTISRETEVRIITARVLRRDRSDEARAA